MTTDTMEVVRADVLSATDKLVGEYERHAHWIADLAGEMTTARDKRSKLASALEDLMTMLDDHQRDALARRVNVADLLIVNATPGGRRPRKAGRPAADGRREALIAILLDWRHGEITTTELTSELRRQGFEVPTRYAPNALFYFAKRGIVLPLGNGRYRINRLHPELRVGA